jgi:hypothetical protein
MKKSTDLMIQGEGWQNMKEQASLIVRSGFLPAAIKTPEQAIAIAMKGHEIGMPMMWSFSHINIIQGKPTIGPEGMLALIYKNCPGAEVVYLKSDRAECSIKARRPSGEWNTFSFTFDDAKALGLTGKDNWIKQPATMLTWRCVAKMARALFPDAIAGISYTPEELGAEVNEDGEVIDVKPVATQKIAAPSNGFDPNNTAHVSSIKGALKKAGVTDEQEQKNLIKDFEGHSSTEILDTINKMFMGFKPTIEVKNAE